MESVQTASRNYEDIKDKYFVLFVPAPVMHAHQLFDSAEEARRYLLGAVHRCADDLDEYARLEDDIAQTGGSLLILNVRQEVERIEKENEYGKGDFRDRQHFLDVIVFGDDEE